MKRFLSFLLGFVFLLSAGVLPAVAAETPTESQITLKDDVKVTLGGELRLRGRYIRNISADDNRPSVATAYGWYDTRVRLFVDARISPGVQGYVLLESESGQTANYNWGSLNGKKSSLYILEAWILYKGSGLFGFPAGLKMGHMPIYVGEKQFLDHVKFGDDAIVFFVDPNKKIHIDLLTIKWREGNIAYNSDDRDAYIGSMIYSFDNNKLGVNYTYLRGKENELGLHNVGLHSNGVIVGDLNYVASTDFQFGKIDSNGDTDKEKFSGYGLLLKLIYKLAPVNIRASFAMGSGDDDLSDDNHKEFQTTRLYRHETPLYSYVYESSIDTAWMDQVIDSGSKNRGNGIANTTYYNIGLDIVPMKNLSAALDGYVFRATKAPWEGSKDMGWEVDSKLEYEIEKNLKYYIVAAYMHPGKGYEESGKIARGERRNATVLRHGIILKF